MAFDPFVGFYLVSGLAYVAFAVGVLRGRPRLRRNVFLAAFLVTTRAAENFQTTRLGWALARFNRASD